eukprot:7524515-Lingulodinium_polyedra.AAC.1
MAPRRQPRPPGLGATSCILVAIPRTERCWRSRRGAARWPSGRTRCLTAWPASPPAGSSTPSLTPEAT